MEKIAFYRKYRPQNFNYLVGQDHVRQTLMNALKEKRTVHAYIFAGPRGTGKTSTARLFAKSLNCLDPDENMEPCNKCEICVSINEGRLIDLIEIDAASNRGIDEIRDLIEKINFAPTRAKNKIYIIDEAHMLTKEAFNALLKTLEEPPAYVYFILCTTEPHKIPETIISRCQRFDFKRIDAKTIMARLSYIAQLEKIEAEDRAIEAIAKNSEGGLRDAIGLMEQLTTNNKLTYEHVKEMLGLSGHENIDEFYKFIESGDASNALLFIQNLYKEGFDLAQFTRELLEVLREKLISAVQKSETDKINRLIAVTDVFQNALDKFKSAAIPQLPLEIAVIELCGYKKDSTPIAAKISAPAVTQIAAESKSTVKKSASAKTKPVSSVSSETTMPEDETIELTLDNISAKWPRIIENIKTPTLKQGFKNAKPDSLKNDTLTLEFKSKFYMDEVLSTNHLNELEKVFMDIFNKKVRINGVLKKIEIEPVISDTDFVTETAPKKSTTANDIAEMFGGEILE